MKREIFYDSREKITKLGKEPKKIKRRNKKEKTQDAISHALLSC